MTLSRRGLLGAGAVLALPAVARSATGRTLVVASWQNYGSDDAATRQQFQTATGATVQNVYFTSEDDLLQILRQGGIGKIDVLLPNLEYVQPAAAQSLIQPIDTGRVKTWDALQPRFRDDASIRHDGHVYAVPWVMGATSLVVNPAAVNPAPDSWGALWDPANKGRVAFFDDPTTAVMTAALYLGQDPQSPDLPAVRKALLDLKANVKLFWSSADDWNKSYTTGAVTMGNLWSGLAGTLNTNGHAVDFILPREGTVLWGDTWAIARDAPNADLAYAWINYMTSPDYFVQWISHPGPNQELAVPVNLDAIKALPPAAANRLMAGKLAQNQGKVALQTGISPAALKKWTELWEEVKAG